MITTHITRHAPLAHPDIVFAIVRMQHHQSLRRTPTSTRAAPSNPQPPVQVRPVTSTSIAAAAILAGKDGVDWSASSALPLLLQRFFAEHKTEIAQCKAGSGVDRHLQGLKWRSELRNGGKADAFFATHGWTELQASFLSTSQMTAEGIQVNRGARERYEKHFTVDEQECVDCVVRA